MSRLFAPNPSPRHEWRVGLLGCLAQLTGHHTDLGAWPDGTIPDVLRADLSRRRLFVGDAKAAEQPGDPAAAARLDGYVDWLAVAVRAGAVGSLAICAPNREEAEDWGKVIEGLLAERDQGVATCLLPLGPGSAVSWSTLSPPPRLRPLPAARAQGDRGDLSYRPTPLPSSVASPRAP